MAMSQNDPASLLTIQQLSVSCGLSIATLHRLKRQGKLPFYQPAGKGGRLLFSPDAIERASAALEQTTPSPNGAGPSHRLSGRGPAWMQTTYSSEEASDHAT